MKRITVVMLAMLSFALGGCPTTGVRTSTTVYTAPVVHAHEHHHETLPGKVVSETTTVEKMKHQDGRVVTKTTTIVRKGKAVDCSDRNPYRDEFKGPCDWRNEFRHLH